MFNWNKYIYFLRSYGARCNSAVTSYNFKPKYISNLLKQITNTIPGLFTKKFIKKVEKLKGQCLIFERSIILEFKFY